MKGLPLTSLYTMSFNDYLNVPIEQIEGLLERIEFFHQLVEGVVKLRKKKEDLEDAALVN